MSSSLLSAQAHVAPFREVLSHKSRKRSACRPTQASIAGDWLDPALAQQLKDSLTASYEAASVRVAAAEQALSDRASELSSGVSSAAADGGGTVTNPLKDLISGLQRQGALGGTQPHFGSQALRSAWDGAVSPRLPQGLSDAVSSGIDRLAAAGSAVTAGSGSWAGPGEALQAAADAARSAGGSVAGLAGSIEASLESSVEVLERNPGSLQPHFGTRAAAQAIQPLTSWAQQQGSGGGLAFRVPTLQEAAASAFQLSQDVLQGAIHSVVEALERSGDSPPAHSLVDFGDRLAAALTHFEANGMGGYSAGFVAAVAIAVSAAIALSVPGQDYDPLQGLVEYTEVPPQYDVKILGQYYASRPVMVTRRAIRVVWAAARFGIGLSLDRLTGGTWNSNSGKRSVQLRQYIEQLGPAYVKVAQALSTRVDILDFNYLTQIELLQDRVPPFPTETALTVMQKAWGVPVDQVLAKISDEPVAAASLGQVYRGRLKGLGGAEVAIKVQRPAVLSAVALDLYLMRSFALLIQQFDAVKTDWAGLIDEWGRRFFAEMDYEAEAASAQLFEQQMAKLDGIVVPRVYNEFTNHEVLMLAWVEGEKLSESNAGDVRELCNTLLNCYLIQLLETGLLHADPHPGNLIRTPDGKICILDFGLMTEVTPEQSLALVEYIAHLSVQDWASVPEDLRKLGFIAPDTPASETLAEPLGRVLSQLSVGGGAKGVNIEQITRDIETLSESYPFEIPAYFALILRCFSVIEGIALRVDPTYSIVGECFPYLARRLLVDNDPRIQAALRATLYGNKTRIDVARLERLASGFSRFTVAGLPASTPAAGRLPAAAAATGTAAVAPEGAQATPILDAKAREALLLVFPPNGSYAAELLAEEAAAAVDALGRRGAFEACSFVLGSIPAAAALSVRAGLPAPFQMLPTPLNFISRLQPVVAPTAEDEEALSLVRALTAILQSASAAAPDATATSRSVQLARELAPLLPQLLPGLLFTGGLFVRKLFSRIAARIAQESLQSGSSGEYIPSVDFMVGDSAAASAAAAARSRSSPLPPLAARGGGDGSISDQQGLAGALFGRPAGAPPPPWLLTLLDSL